MKTDYFTMFVVGMVVWNVALALPLLMLPFPVKAAALSTLGKAVAEDEDSHVA